MPALDDADGADGAATSDPSGANRGALRASGSGDDCSVDDEAAAGSAADDASDTAGMPELDAPGEYGSFFIERSLGGA